MSSALIDTFNEYFEMIPALSDELKREVYRLRYQVYCNEAKFESPDFHPEGLESDEYDEVSVHYLIRHRKSNIYAATTRLILPDLNKFDNLFPIEKYTQIDNFKLIEHIARANLAEASRFCVSKEFKRRKNDSEVTATGIASDWQPALTDDEKRIIPHITIGLFACLIKMSSENDINYWYAVMEPALVRFFTTLGIYFLEIGPLCEYHGKRRPYMIKMSNLLEGVANKNWDYWNFITSKGQFSVWT